MMTEEGIGVGTGDKGLVQEKENTGDNFDFTYIAPDRTN